MVFTGILSVAFLNNQLNFLKWLGISIVTVGLALIGLCDVINSKDKNLDFYGILTG